MRREPGRSDGKAASVGPVPGSDEAEGNAALIARAPEMRALLELAAHRLDRFDSLTREWNEGELVKQLAADIRALFTCIDGD